MFLPPSLRLVIYNPAYEPSYKPANGRLTAQYNGLRIVVKVSGVDIHCCFQTPETTFCAGMEQMEPRHMSWENIMRAAITQALVQVTSYAECQRIYLQGEGEYYVQ